MTDDITLAEGLHALHKRFSLERNGKGEVTRKEAPGCQVIQAMCERRFQKGHGVS
jgi:hypothetical protein